jgi:hypothetical protein
MSNEIPTNQPGGCGCGNKQTTVQNVTTASSQSSLIAKVFVSSDVQKARMALCKECEHFESMLARCKICGCFLEAKTRLAGFHCALDQIGETPKW